MIKKLVPVIISLFLLFGLIWFSDVNKIYATLIKTNLYYFFLAVGLWFASHIIKIIRWRYLLSTNGVHVNFLASFNIFTAGGFISNITPAKVGEPLKSLILKKSEGVKVSLSVPSIFFERVFDIISLICLSLVSMVFLTKTIESIQDWLLASMAVYSAFIAVTVFVLASKKRTLYVLSNACKLFSFMPKMKGFSGRLEEFAENFHNSLSSYKKKSVYIFVFLLSISIWIIEGFILYTIFMAFGFGVSLASTMFIVPVATLISVITLLPGGIGSSEIVVVLFFTSLFGLTAAEVTSVALVARVSTFWVSTFLGAYIFSKMKYKYKL